MSFWTTYGEYLGGLAILPFYKDWFNPKNKKCSVLGTGKISNPQSPKG